MPTKAGIHPDVNLNSYPEKMRRAIFRIGRDFYVTRSFNAEFIGNSHYWAVLVRPTDEFSIYINTDREILILFSGYNTFEIRTLEAYEKFYALLEHKRVDKSMRFLVSDDQKIESTIRHYLDQHPEYPIIIAATFERFFVLGNVLLDSVRRNYLLRDLFAYQNPLREETFFFGRQHVVSSVLDMAKSGQNSSLFGLRKSGKTSTIYAIQRKARGFSLNVSVIDCQNPSVHARRYDNLLSFVIGQIRDACGQKKSSPFLGNDLPEVSENFFSNMKSVLSLTKNNILLIFDEIENISPMTAASEHWKADNDSVFFWQILRSFLQSEGGGRVSICIVGTSPHILELPKINSIANPAYLYAQKQFIPNLSFDEVKEMIEKLGYFMGIEFPIHVIADIHREFGGHPFFTRQICSKINQIAGNDRPTRVSSKILKRATKEFGGQLDAYLDDILTSLKASYPEEFEILSSVVKGEMDEINDFGREAPELIDHLIGYGLVERLEDDYDIRFGAIKRSLERIIEKEMGGDRWAEISRRRNSLEI